MAETAARRFLRGVAAIVVGSALVACSTGSAPGSRAADVPLQNGKQTTLPVEAMGLSTIAVDAKNVLYMGGAGGISILAPGAATPTRLKLSGFPTVSTLAVAPDGALSFVALDGAVASLAAGSTTPKPLPFGKLQQFSEIAVAHDGTVYLGDNTTDKLLKLSPGATAPIELPVDVVKGLGHMVIDAGDNLFAAMNGSIVKIAKNATSAEPVVGASDHVGGLAVDAAGNLYATDVKANTVSRMPAGGGDWVQLPFSGLQSPTHIAVDGDGTVYVVHEGRQLVRLDAK